MATTCTGCGAHHVGDVCLAQVKGGDSRIHTCTNETRARKQVLAMACTSRCSASTQPQRTCRCSCGGSGHGRHGQAAAPEQRTAPAATGHQQLVRRPGETLPPTHAGVPDRRLLDCILDVVVAIWHLRHGEVRDPAGIPEAELVRGKTVKEIMILEMETEGVEMFGKGTRVTGSYDVGVDRVVVTLIGPDGVTHKGFARAIRAKGTGLMTHKKPEWDPPTVEDLPATNASPACTPKPAQAWTQGMSGKAVPTVPVRASRPTPAPAPSWAAGMRH
jgi:hypothetical protein